MGAKSEQKKTYILQVAKRVFIEKGFRTVTMKDIVEACEISRGGLYLYYNNTAEIFRDLLKMESRQTDAGLEEQLSEDASASEILMVFFKAQKAEIFARKGSLIMAIYEYYYDYKDSGFENALQKQFEMGVEIIRNLIELGIENGEFVCAYPDLEARNMMYAIGTAEQATGEWSTDSPTGTDIGSYYVWYKIVGDRNHNDKIFITPITVTIAPNTYIVTYLPGINGTGFVKDYTLEELQKFDVSFKFAGQVPPQHIPTLREYFELVKDTHIVTNIEIKTSNYEYPGIEQAVYDLIMDELYAEDEEEDD